MFLTKRVNVMKKLLHQSLGDCIMEFPLLYYGTLSNLYPEIDVRDHWHENVLENLKVEKRFCMEMDEPLCKTKVPREGFVLRKANDPVSEAWKLKTDKFKFREAKLVEPCPYSGPLYPENTITYLLPT